MCGVELALSIARMAHAGQVDKAGIDYIHHPIFVAEQLHSDQEKMTALLHDVLEDSELTAEYLIEKGIPNQVVEAVIVLTKAKGISYQSYLKKVKKNSLARAVKLADLKHNSDLTRLKQPTQKDFDRLEKYKKAIAFLST